MDRATPVSFSGLGKCNALDSAKSFLANANHNENDRPKWVTPGKRDEKGWEDLEKRLELFRKLAPIWVEMGLLAQ